MSSISAIFKTVRAGALLGLFWVGTAEAGQAERSAMETVSAVSLSLDGSSRWAATSDFSFLPRLQLWQRPGPVTWSSRFEVRSDARWSERNLYMV